LIHEGGRFIIIDDSPGALRLEHPSFRVYHWGDRKRIMGKYEPAIPRGNGACRDLGFYLAWKESDKDEIIVALDDDCMVLQDDFPGKVVTLLSETERHMPVAGPEHISGTNGVPAE
jgi:hypothetical protein